MTTLTPGIASWQLAQPKHPPSRDEKDPTSKIMMMDPELMKVAQEQMSRMSPDDLANIQQQMMSNPDLMRMASETMKNMSPQDLLNAAQQLKDTPDISQIGLNMANARPDNIALIRSRADAQMNYQLSAAQSLKKQGNDLHTKCRFTDASHKYLLAIDNLKSIAPSEQSRSLSLACSLNLMSCYLKTNQYAECVQQGSQILASDPKNVKALYRRGQAYKELGHFKDALTDLNKALEVSPGDETILDIIRDVKERLAGESGETSSRGLTIEEISEEAETVPSETQSNTLPTTYSATQPKETNSFFNSGGETSSGSHNNSDYLQAFNDNPETIRSFQNFMSKADPDTFSAMSGGKGGLLSPDMFKTASNMISQMPPEDIQKMLKVASSLQGASGVSSSNGVGPGIVPPNITPDMLKTASDMMSKMSSDDLQKMYDMQSSFKAKGPASVQAPLNSDAESSSSGSNRAEGQKNSAVDENTLSSGLNSNLPSRPLSCFPASTSDMQEQMRNQMKDPAMRQMFTSMVKNMNPEMMANMGEQFGFKMSREDAEKAQRAMSSLTPENLDRMMLWADRIQRGVEGAKKTKNWLLGKPGIILAIFMLLLAVFLHRMGYIGS